MSTDLQKMKVKDLREELAKRGLDTAGLKAILIERLESSVSPSSSSATALASASASTPPPPSQQESSSTAQQERPQNQVQAKGEGGSEENGEDRETKPLVVAGNPSVSTGPISEIEKKYKRAERFGMPVQLSEQEKRKSRAERYYIENVPLSSDDVPSFLSYLCTESHIGVLEEMFGSQSATQGPDAVGKSEEEKRKARAERFGTPAITTTDDEARKKARLDRFGTGAKTDPSEEDTTDDEARKKARLDRFGTGAKTDPSEEDKRKARAIRFSQTSQSDGKVSA